MSARDNPGLNRPASGSYGEKADRQKLARSLPPMEPQQQATPIAGPPTSRVDNPPGLPTGQVGRPPGPTPPPGLPRALAGPGGQVPPAQPLIDPVMQATQLPADQRTIMILDTLAASPQVSGEMREWARVVLDILFESSGA